MSFGVCVWRVSPACLLVGFIAAAVARDSSSSASFTFSAMASSSGSSSSGAKLGAAVQHLVLTIPSVGIESNEAVQKLPEECWASLGRQLRHRVECLTREILIGNPGASASGPKPESQVDIDWVMSLTSVELARLANDLDVAEDGQTIVEMRSAVVLELMDQEAAWAAPPMGASTSGSTSRLEECLVQLADALGIKTSSLSVSELRAGVLQALLEQPPPPPPPPPPPTRAPPTQAPPTRVPPRWLGPPPAHEGASKGASKGASSSGYKGASKGASSSGFALAPIPEEWGASSSGSALAAIPPERGAVAPIPEGPHLNPLQEDGGYGESSEP